MFPPRGLVNCGSDGRVVSFRDCPALDRLPSNWSLKVRSSDFPDVVSVTVTFKSKVFLVGPPSRGGPQPCRSARRVPYGRGAQEKRRAPGDRRRASPYSGKSWCLV